MPPYQLTHVGHGMWQAELSSWTGFEQFINDNAGVLARTSIWRGQAAAKWDLSTTLDRLRQQNSSALTAQATEKHLRNFQLAARGRRGVHPPSLTEPEWWALGQHHGLATPLLDWTLSPYVALYFAFEPLHNEGDEFRAVWTLNRPKVQDVADDECSETANTGATTRSLSFIEPMTDENARLVNQGGLFTWAPAGQTVESWIRTRVDASSHGVLLTKLSISNTGREECLRALNAMNINHRSLFPDLHGASRFCNMDFEIASY